MNALIIIGSLLVGGVGGGGIGQVYGEKKDYGWIPVLPLFTMPAGAAIGAIVAGSIAAVVVS